MSSHHDQELRHQIEYSKSNRSSCKKCKKTIPIDTLRVGQETKSRVFDGWDVSWYHVECFKFKPNINFVAQLKHFDLLRWSDQLKMREILGDQSEIVNAREREIYFNEIWSIKDSLADELKTAQIKKMYTENYSLELTPAQVLHYVADGMAYGRIGPCPSCNNLSVLYDGVHFYCRGWATAYTKCDWYGPHCKRYRFKLLRIPGCKYLQEFQFGHAQPPEELANYVPPDHSAGGGAGSGNGEGGELLGDSPVASRKQTNRPQPGSVLMQIDPAFSKYNSSSSKEMVVEESDRYGFTPYNVMLNIADIVHNANSYYKLQLIKCGSKYYCFCKWGRIGTSVGGATDHDFPTLEDALVEFKKKFVDKTGNEWDERGNFKKVPGRFFIVDIDDHETETDSGVGDIPMAIDLAPSKLPEPVQRLVSKLFDPEMMKKQLENLKFDVKKMPLGKISQTQIKNAYRVLTEIQDLLTAEGTPRNKIVDASARFYTLIPHDFGRDQVPMIDTKEQLLAKMRLVDTMSDIEVANNLRKLSAQSSSGNSLDDNYAVLKTDIQHIDSDSFTFRSIKELAESTMDTKEYIFDIQDIYQINREGESQRYSQWEFNNNRMLLWHGSRISNWVGILGQGLRIAPPEAPKTGYRFGKGIYFADTFSVSAGYCATSQSSPYAILALAEVALGNSEALYRDTYMECPTFGFSSSKAIGMRTPMYYDQFNNTTIIKGPVVSNGLDTSCTHNEYVVYDVSQVNIKYLLVVRVLSEKEQYNF
eukprot:gene1539-1936_t